MTDPAVPRAGMLATVRNRRGVVAAVAAVEPFDGETGRLHLVHLEYTDDHAPAEERLLWELEPGRHLLPPNALPDPAHAGGPMPAHDFDALVRAARWTALSPYLDPGDGDGRARREPIASPFHGGVRIESYQLVPLLKALRMPRVNLLIADDVGLGKTVEAGLILTELLLRRRIQRVLVLTPASLRHQWREELWDKFSLPFEVVDRQRTERLRRGLGMDATPWRSFSRIVASYHYLRQPDVLEQFLAASRPRDDSPHLPWDLLIVDECHNLMPSPFGEDSELCRMLRLVAPRFEHRLFLSATPHNGHTRSFTGLLEMLEPVRFSRTSEMGSAMRARIEDVVVRRLKRDINAGSLQRGSARGEPLAGRGHESTLLHPAAPGSAPPRPPTARSRSLRRVRRLPERDTRPRVEGTGAQTSDRRIRGRDSEQAAAVVPHGLRRVLEPGAAGTLRLGAGHREGRGGGRAHTPPGDRRRSRSPAARGHRRDGRRRLAAQLRRPARCRDTRHRGREDYALAAASERGLKLTFMDVTSSTNVRTMIARATAACSRTRSRGTWPATTAT